MHRRWKPRTVIAAAACATAVLITPPVAEAEDCSNQAIIDTCLFGCGAAEAVCGALCGAAISVCNGVCDGTFATCDAGCDVCDAGCSLCCCGICVLCSCSDCEDDCDDCHDSCSSTRTSCKNGCQADCSNCVLNCEAGCPACIPFKQIGESCLPFDIGLFAERCATGLSCWPVLFPGESAFQCFPDDADELLHDESCLTFYSPDLHQGAVDSGNALSFRRRCRCFRGRKRNGLRTRRKVRVLPD